jgi:ABC-type uncharacterized transport system involved in gliding motility auxiliary subunit
MSRIIRILIASFAPLGLALGLGAFAWSLVGARPLPGGLRSWLIAALALVLVHFILRWEDISRGLGLRQLKYGMNTAILVLVVLGILGAVNYLVDRHSKRFDLTENQRYSLSDQTRKVLGGLEDEITITYFQREHDMARGQDRLREYEALTDKLKVDFVDPVRNPAKAQAFDVRGPWPILIVQRGDKRERITNDSEEDITNALIKVTREGQKTVCFVEGEGERSTADTGERGYSGAKKALTDSQYAVQDLFLLREKAVPEECTVVVVAGPEKDLVPEAISPLREFVDAGGRAVIMVEPEFKESFPDLVGLLKEWDIEAGDDVVVDVSGMGQLFGTNELYPLVLDYPYHAITKDFRLMTLFGMARSMKAGDASIEGVTAQDLGRTAPQAWAETTLNLGGTLEFDEKSDHPGPISLAAAATIKVEAPQPEPSPSPAAEEGADGDSGAESEDDATAKTPEGRVVAVGDADFASNALLGVQGNEDFFLNAVAWLAEDIDLISIRPKEPENQTLFLSRQKQRMVAWVALVILPLAFVIAGVATWWRRL